MDRGYIERQGIERVAFTDGLIVTNPLYIKFDAARRGILRRFDHIVEVVWIQDGEIKSRRCWKSGVRIKFSEIAEIPVDAKAIQDAI